MRALIVSVIFALCIGALVFQSFRYIECRVSGKLFIREPFSTWECVENDR